MTIAPPEPAGSPEHFQQAGAGDPAGGPVQRWSAQRKLQAVQRLLRGEPLEMVARSLNVTAARLSQWRERVLAAGAAALKERERDARDDEIARLQAKIGEITMDNELLREKIARMEGGRPPVRRRPKR